MALLIGVCCLIFLIMILGILFFPKIKLGKKVAIGSYWVVSLIGLILLLIIGFGDIRTIGENLIKDTAVNPIKILVLFISMTLLSIFLDEAGFFKFLAKATLKHAGKSQMKLFLLLYLTVSVLTVFTSNDIIILSFTPFICYFAKSAKINPIPYLAAEFVGANTWSMALIIGNPTNIYIATTYGVTFIDYLKVMVVPTLLSGGVALIMLLLFFGRQLKSEIPNEQTVGNAKDEIKDKPNLIIGVILLCLCTVTLAIGSYIQVEMWLVSLAFVIILFIAVLICGTIRRKAPKELLTSLKRAPWELIPFVISMFSIIIILNENGVTGKIAELLNGDYAVYKYGFASFLFANVINNIPMSVLFCSVLEGAGSMQAVFATVIGSNLGALLTPIGALAGIMWNSILNEHGLKYGYLDFLKTGLVVAIPSLISALACLTLFC